MLARFVLVAKIRDVGARKVGASRHRGRDSQEGFVSLAQLVVKLNCVVVSKLS